jgi:hypothetical protein
MKSRHRKHRNAFHRRHSRSWRTRYGGVGKRSRDEEDVPSEDPEIEEEEEEVRPPDPVIRDRLIGDNVYPDSYFEDDFGEEDDDIRQAIINSLNDRDKDDRVRDMMEAANHRERMRRIEARIGHSTSDPKREEREEYFKSAVATATMKLHRLGSFAKKKDLVWLATLEVILEDVQKYIDSGEEIHVDEEQFEEIVAAIDGLGLADKLQEAYLVDEGDAVEYEYDEDA